MNCSFCIVPKTRGVERYRPMDDILEEVEALAESGVKEVTLLGQIVNAMGGENFPVLIKSHLLFSFWKKSTHSRISKE